MRTFLIAFGVISLSSAAPADSRAPCPPLAPGPLAWAVDGVMGGDRYAEVYLDLNEKGRPIVCRLGRNNLLGDDSFFVCNAFAQQWGARARSGPTTVRSYWIEYGPKHAAAEKAVRDKYFRDHPYERSECYPMDASSGYRVGGPGIIGPAYVGY